MALEFAFNPIVVLDPSTGDPAKEAVVQLRATPDGTALPVEDLGGTPLHELKTSDLGILPAHRCSVAMPYVYAGGAVTLQEVAVELMNALPAAQAAQQAAETAAAIVDAWDPETSGFILDAEKGEPDGVATLGGDGKVPTAQLPPGGTPDLSSAGPINQARAESDSVPRWRTNFTGDLELELFDIVQHWVNGRRVAWLNEWGALRGVSPHTWGDALVRGIREEGDGINAGRVVELVDS